MNQIWKIAKRFYGEVNQKHPSIKFGYKIDCNHIEFLDTLVYIDQQNKLQTALFQKSGDRQNFLNGKSEHPYSLKKIIPYSQKRCCHTGNSEGWPTQLKTTSPPTKRSW